MNGFLLLAEFDEVSHPLALLASEDKAKDTADILTYNIVYSLCESVYDLPSYAVLIFIWIVEFVEGVPVSRRKLKTIG